MRPCRSSQRKRPEYKRDPSPHGWTMPKFRFPRELDPIAPRMPIGYAASSSASSTME